MPFSEGGDHVFCFVLFLDGAESTRLRLFDTNPLERFTGVQVPRTFVRTNAAGAAFFRHRVVHHVTGKFFFFESAQSVTSNLALGTVGHVIPQRQTFFLGHHHVLFKFFFFFLQEKFKLVPRFPQRLVLDNVNIHSILQSVHSQSHLFLPKRQRNRLCCCHRQQCQKVIEILHAQREIFGI